VVSGRIPVRVAGLDPISEAGITSQLKARPEVRVVGEDDLESPTVAVVIADVVDETTAQMIRTVHRNFCQRVVLVVTHIDDQALVTAVDAGARGLVRRQQASPEQIVSAIRAAAAGEGMIPPDLLDRLMSQMSNLQRKVLSPRGLTFSGLSEREIQVLKLVADGYDTAEIARVLAYSERTIKNVIRDVISRFQLRNRSHAVAYALRQGLI
jgi:DNA-binding NarL/FixJ family response regulator